MCGHLSWYCSVVQLSVYIFCLGWAVFGIEIEGGEGEFPREMHPSIPPYQLFYCDTTFVFASTCSFPHHPHLVPNLPITSPYSPPSPGPYSPHHLSLLTSLTWSLLSPSPLPTFTFTYITVRKLTDEAIA